MVFSECSPQLCPCSDKCENQKIQKHEWAPGLQRFMTEDKGWGVRTQQAIKSGDFILEYVGEVVSEREFKSRMATRYDSFLVYTRYQIVKNFFILVIKFTKIYLEKFIKV